MITWFIWFLVLCTFFAADYLRREFLFSRFNKHFFYYGLLLAAILFGGFRYKIGNDYDNYARLYVVTATNPLSTYMEPGYAYFCYFLNVIGLSFQGMFLLFCTAIVLLFGYGIRKYSVHPALSFMIFLLVPAYYFNSLCILRQFFAMAVVFGCLPLIVERKFWKFFLIILLVSTFHKSALLILPFYFLAPYNINKFLLLGVLIVVIVFPPFRLLNDFILLRDYDEYLNSKAPEFKGGITLIFRIAVFIFILFSRDRLEDKASKMITNLYLIGVVCYFATITTEAMSRISLYLTIFEVIAIVNTFYLYTRKDRIRMGMVYITYCTLLFFQNLNAYSQYYNRGTSEGNINYSVNFDLLN